VSRFWLVQRIKRSPYQRHVEAFPNAKVKSNPFGYGRLGDYELDYMGAAEFEFDAIPEANNRLAKAGKDLALSLGEREYQGRALDFLWIGKEGDPWERWVAWANGDPYTSEFGICERSRGFEGKERPFDFERKLSEPDYEYGGDVWWALNENVQWAFHDGEDGHLLQMLRSMQSEPVEFLR
jgi:hypothetical protein